MGNVKIGNGFDDGVTCGPLINAGALETVDGLVKVAVGAGASVALGGSPAGGPGFFYLPTVLGDVGARLARSRARRSSGRWRR